MDTRTLRNGPVETVKPVEFTGKTFSTGSFYLGPIETVKPVEFTGKTFSTGSFYLGPIKVRMGPK